MYLSDLKYKQLLQWVDLIKFHIDVIFDLYDKLIFYAECPPQIYNSSKLEIVKVNL